MPNRIIEEYDVVTNSPDIHAGSLSGGNLQKLILGREFSQNARF
jgi:general nucleoside transport system ATP-binding protein